MVIIVFQAILWYNNKYKKQRKGASRVRGQGKNKWQKKRKKLSENLLKKDSPKAVKKLRKNLIGPEKALDQQQKEGALNCEPFNFIY